MRKLIFALLPLFYLFLLLFQKDLAMLGDLGRHLKVGEVILNCRCIPQTNLFSYTHPDFPIVNHEWLGEIIFYLISVAFGVEALLILKMILVLVSASLLYTVALQKGSLFWVSIFSFLSITIFSTRFHVLPELWSYLFISVFIFLIEKYKSSKNIQYLWALPIIELLWVNMHIYFILGIALYSFFFLEEFIRHKKINKQFLLIGVALTLVTFANPSFIRGALLPFTVFNNYGFPVEENKSISTILSPTSTNTDMAYTFFLQILVFEVLMCAFIFCFFVKKPWKELFHVGNGSISIILGFRFVRCVSLFGLLGFIPLVQAFTLLEKKLHRRYGQTLQIIVKGVSVIIVAVIVLIHIKGLFEYQILHFGFVPSSENVVAFMKEAKIQGKIFNNYIIGNYLIYGLYPEQQVYVDARPEAYPATFFDAYWRMMSDPQFFDNQVEKYSINAVIFNVAIDDPVIIRPFLTRLIESKEWIPVYADGQITVLLRNVEMNSVVIEEYQIVIPVN